MDFEELKGVVAYIKDDQVSVEDAAVQLYLFIQKYREKCEKVWRETISCCQS